MLCLLKEVDDKLKIDMKKIELKKITFKSVREECHTIPQKFLKTIIGGYYGGCGGMGGPINHCCSISFTDDTVDYHACSLDYEYCIAAIESVALSSGKEICGVECH